MDKKKLIQILAGLGIIGTITIMAADYNPKADEICIKKSKTEQACFANNDYENAKKELYNRFQANQGKGYDFDINNKNALEKILNEELKRNGPISINGNITKGKIKQQLIKRLND